MELEQKKQEEVVKLYALRAGLSVLSEIYDETEAIKAENIRNEAELKNAKEDLDTCIASHREKMNTLEDRLTHGRKRSERYKEEVKKYSKQIDIILKSKKKWAISFFIAALLYIAGFFSVMYWVEAETTLSYFLIVVIVIAGFTSFVSLIGCAYYLLTSNQKIKSINNALERPEMQLRHELNALNRAEQEKREEMETFPQRCQLIKKEYDEKKEQYEQGVLKASEQNQILTEKFMATHKAMQEEFSSFLDERDWGNVDYIIFNYETGRALDMRDALLQVDNERRNERLIKVVEHASTSISASIGRGFGALRASLDRQLSSLDNRIAGFKGEMSEIARSNAAHSRALEAQLGKIAEISSSQQALLSKMNTSSTRMAEDVETMKRISEETFRNAR